MSAATWTIVPVDLLDPDGQELAQAWVDVFTADQAHTFADGGSPWQLSELQGFHRNPAKRRQGWAARADDGTLLGSVEVIEPLRDNLDSASLWLAVHPDHRRRGVGTALLAHAEAVALGDGRHVLMTDSEFPVDGVDPAQEFATRHGWALAQTAPRSALTLPGDEAWRARLAVIRDGGDVATTADPAAYRVETCFDVPPPEWLPGLAGMYRRMSTDMPLGELALEEEDWDADRVLDMVETLVAAGRRLVTSVALDREDTMVGFTELGVSAGTPHLAYQGSTLVAREQRGHRIGLRLKAANALALMEHLPAVTTVRTWNADDNAPMLAVNRELGFAVDAWERAWQKRVVPD